MKKNRQLYFISAVLVFMMILINFLHAVIEIGAPFIMNYYPKEYRGDPQTWSILQDYRGVMYFGNNGGAILEFDGQFWKPCAFIANRSRVCSMDIGENGTIYVGGNDEFGYLEVDQSGQMIYVSLLNKIPENQRKFNEVWRLYATTHGVYYFTHTQIFRYFRGIIELLQDNPMGDVNSIRIDDNIFFFNEKGLCCLQNGQLTVLPHSKIFSNDAYYLQILPYPGNKLLLIDEVHGCMIYDLPRLLDSSGMLQSDNYISDQYITKDILSRFPTEIDEFIKTHRNYSATVIKGNYYAVGTMTGGIAVMDQWGKLVRIIDKNQGLPQQIILYLYGDRCGNLWAAMNGLISYIETASPLSCFNELHGVGDYLLSIERFNDFLYVGGFKGVYKLAGPEDSFGWANHFIQVEKGNSTWTFLKTNGHLLAGATSWLYIIGPNDQTERIRIIGTVLHLHQSGRFPDYIFCGLAAPGGLELLKTEVQPFLKNKNKLLMSVKKITPEKMKTIKQVVQKIIEDDQGNLWLSTDHDGILYLRFNNDDVNDFDLFSFTREQGLFDNNHNFLNYFNQFLWVASGNGVLRSNQKIDQNFNPDTLRFQLDDTFAAEINQSKISIFELHMKTGSPVWINTGADIIKINQQDDGNYIYHRTPLRKTKVELFYRFYYEENGIGWICSNLGLFRYDYNWPQQTLPDYSALIRRVTAARKKVLFSGNYYSETAENKTSPMIRQTGLVQPNRLKPMLKYRENQMIFEYAAPFFQFPKDTVFSYKLAGMDKEWSVWENDSKKEYTNIPEGSYCFKVKALNIMNQESLEANYEFTILPPWQRTVWAYLGFVIILGVFFYGGIRLNTRRLRAAKQKLEKIVALRTEEVSRQKQELETANINLNSTNSQLLEAKNALWGEMELAKKIQTVLLPQQPEIPGYEIAAYMNPADEVGGDYYDVIRVEEEQRVVPEGITPRWGEKDRGWRVDAEREEEKDGEPCRGGSCARPKDSGQPQGADPQHPNMGNHKGLPLQIYQPPTTIHFPQAGGYPFSDQPLSTVSKPSYWLTIGDVSGHGVPAGLVMMMAQTAIRTALKTHGQGNPKQVLEIANAILYDNIKKMGEDKYMSLTLLSVQPSGTIYYSGLHQDIMVYRAAKKTVELVETQGIWMGISNEISNMLKTDYFVLDGGDAVLLYTDGVTEAINAQGAMFSDEKLIELFRCCGHLSPAAVKTEILTALQNYSCTDDVTMIIMKRTEG